VRKETSVTIPRVTCAGLANLSQDGLSTPTALSSLVFAARLSHSWCKLVLLKALRVGLTSLPSMNAWAKNPLELESVPMLGKSRK
jgi:hypothetical protein